MKVLDVQSRMDFLVDDYGREYPFIIVTAFHNGDDELYYDFWFAMESDRDDAEDTGIDCSFFGYLPDSLFDTHRRNELSLKSEISSVWDYVEKNFD